MKINIFNRALGSLLEKVTLVKTSKIEQEIAHSYCAHLKEAFTDIIYHYVQTKDGKEALYIYPDYKLISGESTLKKKELERLPKKSYKGRVELTENEPTKDLFNRLLNDYKEKQRKQSYESKYRDGFLYLQSLYYAPNDEYLEAYQTLYNDVKNECDRLGIIYETEPEKILATKLESLKDNEKPGYIDVSICKSKESIDKYYEENVLSCKNNNEFSKAIRDLEYLRMTYTFAYPGEFLKQEENLICALEDKNYPNRESILKNYLEFFNTKDVAFGTTNYLDKLTAQATKKQMHEDIERFNKNPKFLEDLEKITRHDQDKEIYRYHATTSKEDAERIIEEGFYLYSDNLNSTSFAEFDINQILTYSYGNLFESFGDFIIIISEPKDEDIVKKLTEEERENVHIMPRRMAMVANKPSYKIDKKHVVGLVDKKNEQIIFNEEYTNSRKKQTNI